MSDLLEYVALQSVECLNEKASGDWGKAIKQGLRDQDGLVLESDTDEQLLIHIPFTQKVKLSGIAFAAAPGATAKAPKTVKLFVNRPHVGFSDADSTPSAQEITLTAADLEEGDGAGKTLPLKPARFTGVDVLSIFIEDNQEGEDTTALGRLTLFGTAGDTFDVAAIKKIEEK